MAFYPIQANSMDPIARAFLMALSRGESGRASPYNVMFSPGKRRYFSDFAQHPNNPAVIPSGPHKGQSSSAAGRYQFIKPTWDAVSSRLGLSDFSPANQDVAAWAHAQASLPGLAGELRSGDPRRIRAAFSGLAPQWAALGGGGAGRATDDFMSLIAAAGPKTPEAGFQPEGGSMTPQQRINQGWSPFGGGTPPPGGSPPPGGGAPPGSVGAGSGTAVAGASGQTSAAIDFSDQAQDAGSDQNPLGNLAKSLAAAIQTPGQGPGGAVAGSAPMPTPQAPPMQPVRMTPPQTGNPFAALAASQMPQLPPRMLQPRMMPPRRMG